MFENASLRFTVLSYTTSENTQMLQFGLKVLWEKQTVELNEKHWADTIYLS